MTKFDVIVIGASQAGLAMGYFLQKQKRNFLIIGREQQIGDMWRSRYDSLKLFTSREYSQLPGLPFPGEPNDFPTKDEVAHYLATYADHFQLPIQLDTNVLTLVQEEERFIVQTNKGKLTANHVVIATGPFQKRSVPAFSESLSATVLQLHSSQYRNPAQLEEGSTLVVGGGNSGAQIAVELANVNRQVYFSVSRPLRYAPLSVMNKSAFWWLERLGVLYAPASSFRGKWLRQKGDPIFGKELKELISQDKIRTKPRATRAQENHIHFLDRSTLEVNNIIWATGFNFDYTWIQIPDVLNGNGFPTHQRGVTKLKGLYFLGLPWQSSRGSALITGVGRDAEYLAQVIHRYSNYIKKSLLGG